MNGKDEIPASEKPTIRIGRRRRRLWIFVLVFLGPGLAWFAAMRLYDLRPLPPLPVPSGKILQSTQREWGDIVLDGNRCELINNVWNKAAAGQGFEQEVFVEDTNGKRLPGWRWRAPWQMMPNVISQPQIVCGDKPWDTPRHLIPEFPFRAGARRLTADFDIRMQAAGTYNMTFSVWAVSSLPASRSTISHEIMIWNARSGQQPAGQKRGVLNVQGTDYDVYVEENHKDNSGATTATWTYVAFVARKPVLHGPLEITAFTRYLVEQKLLSTDHYLTSLELGNEVCQGTGIVELQNFALRFE